MGRGLVRRVISNRFRVGALALMWACTPEAAKQSDGGMVSGVNRDDAGRITSFSSATVQIAGLLGQGLTLTLNGTQKLEVPSDGVFKVPLTVPVSTLDMTIATQPRAPHQLCEITKIDDNVFSVICGSRQWSVSGTLAGYDGNGLQLGLFDDSKDELAGVPHNLVNPTGSGPFEFERPLDDGVNYEVRIVAQPTQPRQDCALENAEGFADGANITNVKVTCTTKTYVFTSVITGLLGTGLSIKTTDGTYTIDNPGTTTYSDNPYPDGFQYDIEIATQPKNPDQLCFIQGGQGIIDGANVTYTITCGALNNVRVAEIGACPFSSSSCWFEVYNNGATPENLAFYKLRTSALSPAEFVPSRVFTLPSIAVPAFGRVVIQGKTPGALPDGEGVYHVGDGDVVPWWGANGFLELLNPDGATADFVRFGSNTIEPTTGGIWSGGACPALPTGNAGYGRSLQYIQGGGGTPRRPSEFALRAFATYGGSNDITSDADNDNDGIPDEAEIDGTTFSSLNLYQMGARQNQRDVFIEIDHMAGGDPATLPRKEALDKIVQSFARRGVALHFDVGNLFAAAFNPDQYNLGGGNEVPFSRAIGLAPADASITNLYDIKGTNMAGNRRMVFYYQLFAWSQRADGRGGSSGVGEMPGNDSIITLGGFGLSTGNVAQRNLVTNYQAASVMHELGHNFGLRHGGNDAINRKPNYVSVMNYLYSPLGLPTIGNVEGDRYDFYKRCSLTSVTQLTNAPSADPGKFEIDYSLGASTTLDESLLNESQGLGRPSSVAVDFNCNKKTDTVAYLQDLNGDSSLDVLADNNDWGALDFVFRRNGSGAENGPLLLDIQSHEDLLTDDVTHRTDEPCPAPYVEDLSAVE